MKKHLDNWDSKYATEEERNIALKKGEYIIPRSNSFTSPEVNNFVCSIYSKKKI